MAHLNEHYLKLKAGYLFPEISRRVRTFTDRHPQSAQRLIRCGIGDVTEPLPAAAVEALHQAADEMSRHETFHGYGPEQGYEFLRTAIAQHDYRDHGMQVADDEIFVSDGSKCDAGNILDIFGPQNRIAVMDPVYPVYVDTNVMAGHTGPADDAGAYAGLMYLPCTAENGFVPALPTEPVDLVYLCYPNNPTGTTATRNQLTAWVEYARKHRAILLYDAAYESFIRNDELPKSIYEIEGAREVAIEFRSFSKTAGFTGIRCAFTVVPKSCFAYTEDGRQHPLHALWYRRHATKFNGVSYPVQRAAEAVYSREGKIQTKALIDYYMKNAVLIRREMSALGFDCIGGENSPYIWVDGRSDSWQFFDLLLEKAGVVCTPGAGFGKCGEGYIRISAFNNYDNVEKALGRIKEALRA